MSRRKCTVQRCQGQPSTWAIAALQTLVGIGDAQPHAVQAAGHQAAQELAPESLGLGLTDVEAQTSRRPLSCTP